MEAKHDPVAHRFSPDRELLARAFNDLLDEEDPGERFVRQRWDEALGAVRVALAALREIYPSETYFLSSEGQVEIEAALRGVERAHLGLNRVEGEMIGELTQAVVHGNVTTIDHYKELRVEQA